MLDRNFVRTLYEIVFHLIERFFSQPTPIFKG